MRFAFEGGNQASQNLMIRFFMRPGGSYFFQVAAKVLSIDVSQIIGSVSAGHLPEGSGTESGIENTMTAKFCGVEDFFEWFGNFGRGISVTGWVITDTVIASGKSLR